MAHKLLREQAIQLRLQGNTYSQIKRDLGISKGTLSYWLHKYPLSEERLKQLLVDRDHKRDIAVERYRNTIREQRVSRLKKIYSQKQKELLPLTKKELMLSGLFLYWGEGSKQRGIICISNTNPQVIVFALHWMTTALHIPKEKIKALIHLYQDMEIDETMDYWAKILGFNKEQFRKPYIKKTNILGLTYKSFGHGTCNLYFSSVLLSEEVAMSIKAVSEYYGAKNDLFWYN